MRKSPLSQTPAGLALSQPPVCLPQVVLPVLLIHSPPCYQSLPSTAGCAQAPCPSVGLPGMTSLLPALPTYAFPAPGWTFTWMSQITLYKNSHCYTSHTINFTLSPGCGNHNPPVYELAYLRHFQQTESKFIHTVAHYQYFNSFLWLTNSPLYRFTMFYLPIHQLKPCSHEHLCTGFCVGIRFQLSCSAYLRVGLLGHMVITNLF